MALFLFSKVRFSSKLKRLKPSWNVEFSKMEIFHVLSASRSDKSAIWVRKPRNHLECQYIIWFRKMKNTLCGQIAQFLPSPGLLYIGHQWKHERFTFNECLRWRSIEKSNISVDHFQKWVVDPFRSFPKIVREMKQIHSRSSSITTRCRRCFQAERQRLLNRLRRSAKG